MTLKKRLTFIILTLLFISFKGYAANKTITFGTESWIPFAFKDNEKPAGFDYDVTKAVFASIGLYRLPWNWREAF